MRINYLSKLSLIVIFFVFIPFCAVSQQFNDAYISMKYRDLLPENWETRVEQRNVLENQEQIPGIWQGRFLQTENQEIIQYSIETGSGGYIYYNFLREDNNKEINELSAGNISVKRDINTYEYKYMTIIIRDNRGDSYVRIYPLNNSSSVIDVKLFNVIIYKDVILPVNFRSLLTIPFSYIAELSAGLIDWESIFFKQEPENGILDIIYKIREFLPYLNKEDDAAFDSSGNSVYIETELTANGGVNCVGFAKWVVDGLYFPYTEYYIDIDALKTRHLEYRGNFFSNQYEDIEDPYFGLDWTRNLAVILNEARLGIPINNPEEYDVRNVEHFYYTEDIGYKVEDLELILYLLSQKNPGNIYIGSINNHRYNTALREHNHVAVFFPVYDENSDFKVIVMEDGYEITLESFINDYGYYPPGSGESANEYIHLIEIYAKGDFEPMEISGH